MDWSISKKNKYDEEWFDIRWYNEEWFDKQWYDEEWFDKEWFNEKWYNEEWYDKEWYDRLWYDEKWFNKEWNKKRSLYDQEVVLSFDERIESEQLEDLLEQSWWSWSDLIRQLWDVEVDASMFYDDDDYDINDWREKP